MTSVPAYLVDPSGQLVVDPRNPEHRAARVLQLMNEAEIADQAWITDTADDWEALDGESDEADESLDGESDEFIDSMDWWAA